ncbi:chemokine-like protein TAFA-5a isoform X1 [Pungitius pungitius]|uniref:chemokine-like protein TAFA-5a isoform X1 n=1 Tax=Pungitius pungitius TaxID=134920 RepID=UPI001887C4A9|nr:chemokine-like protein TAFA-5a isoform X1 [Pungitius pungitius]
MESIDDPLTDSQKTSANNTLPPPPPPTSQQLHQNPGPAKAGSNTSSYRATRASLREQGLMTQPEMVKPGIDCWREQAFPRTLDKLPVVKQISISCDKPLRVPDCCHLLSVIGSKCCVHLLSTTSACSVKFAVPALLVADWTL